MKNVTEALAQKIYRRARQLDQWPGEDYDGSSVIGAVKAGVEEGWYTEYRWAFGLEDLMLAVSYKGPAILGINWYTGMFKTDSIGWIRVTGKVEGGHAVLCNGIKIVKHSDGTINYDLSYFLLHNSWGKDWGIEGRAKISLNDMRLLLAQNGEACIPVKRLSGRAA